MIAQLLRQWIAQFKAPGNRIELRLSCGVTEVSIDRTNAERAIVKRKHNRDTYDVVVIAAGYGIERPPRSRTASYWRNDDLAQPVLDAENKRRYLVSGTGDGGLIEVLRLTIQDFQHQRFIQEVMYDKWLFLQARNLKKKLDKSKVPEEVSLVWKSFISGKHKSLKEPSFLSLQRNDTRVYLNATKAYPSRTRAQMLHRLCVALLIRRGLVKYVEGKLISVYSDGSGEKVALIRGPRGDMHLQVNEVIERHDSEPTLDKLFPNDPHLLKRLQDSWEKTEDKTWLQHYPVGYLADEFMAGHLETGYQIGFVLPDALETAALRRAVEACFRHLGFFGPALVPQEVLDWINRITSPNNPDEAVRWTWQQDPWAEKEFSFSIEKDTYILQHHGTDPQSDPVPFSWRFFVPGEFRRLNINNSDHFCARMLVRRCLFLNTTSRRLIEQLLKQDQLRYHVYRTYLRDNFDMYLGKNFPPAKGEQQEQPTPLVSLDTQVFLLSRMDLEDRYFEAQCSSGLLLAHMLLRAPTALEILLNRWPTTKVHGVGWAVMTTRQVIQNQQEGNRLLQWNP